MCDYTVWIVFYDLFALSENDEIKMINQSIKSRLFTQPFLHVQIKENIKAPRRWHLSGENHSWPVNSSHKGPVTGKMFPLDDGIMHAVHL